MTGQAFEKEATQTPPWLGLTITNPLIQQAHVCSDSQWARKVTRTFNYSDTTLRLVICWSSGPMVKKEKLRVGQLLGVWNLVRCTCLFTYVYVFVHTHATAYLCRPEDKVQDLVLCFHCVAPRHWTQVLQLSHKLLYLSRLLTGPLVCFY